jgi:hypothetical protein
LEQERAKMEELLSRLSRETGRLEQAAKEMRESSGAQPPEGAN